LSDLFAPYFAKTIQRRAAPFVAGVALEFIEYHFISGVKRTVSPRVGRAEKADNWHGKSTSRLESKCVAADKQRSSLNEGNDFFYG
jgi:hypothetical protein